MISTSVAGALIRNPEKVYAVHSPTEAVKASKIFLINCLTLTSWSGEQVLTA